jgi:hypothetical protein
LAVFDRIESVILLPQAAIEVFKFPHLFNFQVTEASSEDY